MSGKRRRSLLRHRAEHFLFRAAAGTLALLPEGLQRRLGQLAARLYISLARSRRRILLSNLTAAFPEKSEEEIKRIARKSVENFVATLQEFLGSVALSPEDIRRRVSVAGEEHLAAARARGKGVFLLTAHLGNWELAALRVGLMGEPMWSVGRPLDNPLLEKELSSRRTRLGNVVIDKRAGAREMLRALREKKSVAILLDQNVIKEEAVFALFFGRPAATSPAVGLLQQKTGAAVVPVFTWPLGKGRHRIEFGKPIFPEEFTGSTREERVRQATARFVELTEEAIRKDPSAWLWIHNRWRTRPPE